MPTGIYKRKKISYHPRPNNRGENNYKWKGDKVGYAGLHTWIKKVAGSNQECENCGTTEIPKGKKRWFEWANISGEYLRDRADWKRLCVPCHREMDGSTLKKVGAENVNSKLTEKQVRVIKWALYYGTTALYLAKAFKVHYNTINHILRGKTWSHVVINPT